MEMWDEDAKSLEHAIERFCGDKVNAGELFVRVVLRAKREIVLECKLQGNRVVRVPESHPDYENEVIAKLTEIVRRGLRRYCVTHRDT